MEETTMITHEGICKYCGQAMGVMAANQNLANGLVTEKCDCGGYARERRYMRAECYIDNTFGPGCASKNLQVVEDPVIKLLYQTAKAINEEYIDGATLNLGGIKASLKMTTKGYIKISRTDAKQQQTEV